MGHTVFGGIFPAPRKENTRRKPIQPLDRPPKQVILPLRMCARGNAVPVVKPGDQVTVGQVIARPQGEGVAVHASVSGRVEAVEPRPHPWGGTDTAIVIENDLLDTPCPDCPPPVDVRGLTRKELLDRLQQSGLVGMGGGAFPTYLKVRQAMDRADTLIVNAVECEPYITADHRLLLEEGDQILQGAQLLARILGCQRAVLAVEGDKLNAVEFLERRLRRKKRAVELCTVRTRYPLGAEKQIIQAVTGREVPPGGSALDVKCAVFNVATVYALRDNLVEGRPLTHRAVTVAGGPVQRPRNLWVPIGTPLRCLLESAGGLKEKPDIILTGGPMMGRAQTDLEAPVVKNTSGLVCLFNWERGMDKAQRESVCVRCGRCVASCPMHLAPAFVYRALRQGEEFRLPSLHLADCIQCGCCSYSCPSHIPLADLVQQARTQLEKGGAAQ